MFSILRFENIPRTGNNRRIKLISDFYQITLKKECPYKIQYGQNPFDFDEGIISCSAPKQVFTINEDFEFPEGGWILNIHPDLFRGYPLGQKIKSLGFFDYEINEELILSEEEQRSVEIIFKQIEIETNLPIDHFSQDVMISNINLLLTHFNRYYNRQFIIGKPNNKQLLTDFERILNDYFATSEIGLLTVQYMVSKFNLSSKYLSDCLKQITGHTAQQLIHDKLIEMLKIF